MKTYILTRIILKWSIANRGICRRRYIIKDKPTLILSEQHIKGKKNKNTK